MVRELVELGKKRYIGDSRTRLVHDRWHADCQGCGVRNILRDGHAVGFEPDTLDAAFWAGYDYCEACNDKTEPSPPRWARARTVTRESGTERKLDAVGAPSPDREYEVHHRHALASAREKAEVTG